MASMSNHESTAHGTPDFPCEYHCIQEGHPRYNMDFHWHKEWELIRIKEGIFSMHAGDFPIEAGPGDLVLLHDSMLHGGRPKDCVYECFLFDLHQLFHSFEGVKKHLRPIYRLTLLPQVYFPVGASPRITRAAAEILDCCHIEDGQPVYNELRLLGAICQFFGCILEENRCTPSDEASRLHRIGSVKAVLEYIEQNYAAPADLQLLSQIAGMHPAYFCKLFRQVVKQTPMAYLTNYRADQAAIRLSSGNASITEVALDCGFNDPSYFIRVFKKLKGITPKQYQLQRHQ